MSGLHIRALREHESALIALVATRMRDTLVEVLGHERGAAMYSEEWLRARVREHLPGGPLEGAVFVAETGGVACGHVILRPEAGFGLFSTIYVTPSQRRSGLGDALITHGERWFVERGLTAFATHTATDNGRLRALLKRRGYREVLRSGGMVRLERSAELGAPPDLGGPDSEGPDLGGPDSGGPDSGGL